MKRPTGYGYSADIWSFAVMVYEMIVGMTPFYDRAEMTEIELYKRITDGNYEFPDDDDFMSPEARDLIVQLLVVNPRDRLGCFAGAHDDISRHPWFSPIDWDAIEQQKAQVPWEPQVKNPLEDENEHNSSQLNQKDEEDEEEQPLSAQEQSLFDEF